jgi:hypothetical protein
MLVLPGGRKPGCGLECNLMPGGKESPRRCDGSKKKSDDGVAGLNMEDDNFCCSC